jgi:myosin-1
MAALTDEHGLANDLVLLDDSSTNNVVELIQKRFKNSKIYTYIGEVVVSVNPYRSLNIYEQQHIQEYIGREQWENQPHLFALAESVYQTIKVVPSRQFKFLIDNLETKKKYMCDYNRRIWIRKN